MNDMTLRGLIHDVVTAGDLLVVFNILYDEYYADRDDINDNSIDYVIESYASVCKELIKLDVEEYMYYSDDQLYVSEEADLDGEIYIGVCLRNKVTEDTYAVDFIPWNELIDLEIYSLTNLDKNAILAHILWEITFYGYTSEKVNKEREKLEKLIDDIDSGVEELIPFIPALSGTDFL